MTTATDFESQLDDNPSDWTLRSIYADWLEEQGNPRAESMRWMVANEKCPDYDSRFSNSWDWWFWESTSWRDIGPVFDHLCEGYTSNDDNYVEYQTRVAAEIDLHNALVKAGEITCALIEEVGA